MANCEIAEPVLASNLSIPTISSLIHSFVLSSFLHPFSQNMSQSDATAKKKQRPQVKPIGQPGGNKTTGGSGLTGPAPAGPPRDSEDWSKSGTYHLKEIGVKISTTGVSKVGEGAPAPGEQPRPQTAPDDVLDPDNLVEERLLGKGASGMVVLYKDKTNGKQYAVKIISLNTATAAADSKMIAEVTPCTKHRPGRPYLGRPYLLLVVRFARFTQHADLGFDQTP